MNQKQGVILYSRSASTKGTVASALTVQDTRYRQFRQLKIGSGKNTAYRMGTAEELRALKAAGDVVYANSPHGNTYVIDRPGLTSAFEVGVPVLHLDQVEGIRAVVDGYEADWALILLWCPQEVTAQRSEGWDDSDTTARLAAWEEVTQENLEANPAVLWDLTVDTSVTSPECTAWLIDQFMSEQARTTAWARATAGRIG